MKFIVITAIFLFGANAFAQTGWRYLNSGVSQNLNSVEFANENFGIVVGDSGTALKTTDGGQNWQRMSFPFEIELLKTNFVSVAFTGEGSAVIAGNSVQTIDSISKRVPLILRTEDAGQTWQLGKFDNENDIDPRLGVSKMCMSNGSVGFLTLTYYHASSQIFKTTDGGVSWNLYKNYNSRTIEDLSCSQNNSFIISVRTTERHHGAEFGRINTIIEVPDSNIVRTSEKGDSYNWFGGFWAQSTGESTWVLFRKDVLGSGATGKIRQSFDNGITWNTIEVEYPHICKLFFQNSYTGYALSCKDGPSPSMILKSLDGGATWSQQKHPADIPYIQSIFNVNDTMAYAVGVKGIILKVSDDATSINDSHNELLKETKAYPNPAANELIIDGISGEITLISSFGEVVWRGFKNEEKMKIDVSALPQGIYVLKYSAGAQMISVVR